MHFDPLGTGALEILTLKEWVAGGAMVRIPPPQLSHLSLHFVFHEPLTTSDMPCHRVPVLVTEAQQCIFLPYQGRVCRLLTKRKCKPLSPLRDVLSLVLPEAFPLLGDDSVNLFGKHSN